MDVQQYHTRQSAHHRHPVWPDAIWRKIYHGDTARRLQLKPSSECQGMSDREKGEDDERRRVKGRGDTVALFPQRSRLSWPKQSQSPQPRKTNGGKSQPGGFDPLKGLWDLINMQLFCVKHRHKYMLWNVCRTRSDLHTSVRTKAFRAHTSKHVDMISDSSLNAMRGGTKTCVHTLQSYTHHESLAKEVKAIKIFSWLLPDYTVTGRKPGRYYLPALRGISECAVQAFSPSLFSMYGFPSPHPLHHTVSSSPTQQAPLPHPALTTPWEDGATREKLIEI